MACPSSSFSLELMQIKRHYHERRCGYGHATRAEPGHTPDFGDTLPFQPIISREGKGVA
jgi:hypothetical protein